MNKREIQFAIVTNGKEVTTIGRSSISHPAIRYANREIKWLEDKPLLKNRK